MVHYRGGAAAIDKSVYPDEDEFWADLSAAYAKQVAGIAELGGTYLQLDDTSLAYLNDPAQRAMLTSQGRDAEHQHERYIRQINSAIAGPSRLAARHHAHVPRQLPLVVGRRGRLRLRRRGAVRPTRRRRLLPRVRRRPLGRLLAAALRAARQVRRARSGHDQAAGTRVEGRPEAPHRRGREVTSRSSSCACRRSAASRRPSRATRSPATSRSPSCGWSSRLPRRSGARTSLLPARSSRRWSARTSPDRRPRRGCARAAHRGRRAAAVR